MTVSLICQRQKAINYSESQHIKFQEYQKITISNT